MQVADKNVPNAGAFDFVLGKLDLGSFSAVNHK